MSLKQHLLVAALAQATRQNTLGAMCAVNDVRRVNGATPCRKVRFTRSTKAVFSRPLSPKVKPRWNPQMQCDRLKGQRTGKGSRGWQ